MTEPRYNGLRDYLQVIGAHKLLIVVVTLLAGGAAFAFSARQNPVYTSTTTMAFQDEQRDLTLLGTSVASGSAPDQLPAARAETVNSPAVSARVKAALGSSATPEQLAAAVHPSVDNASSLVKVTADAGTAKFSAALANEFARQSARYSNQQARRRFGRAADTVRHRLHGLGHAQSDLAQRAALTDQLSRLDFLHTSAAPGRIIKLADPPGSPSSPRPVRNTALGLLLGLALGLAAAFVRDTLDRRLRGSHDIERELGLPIVGRVRSEAMGRAVGPSDALDSKLVADVESFRIIQRHMEYLSSEPMRTVVVTSAIPEEGKSTVAASVAAAAAAAGKRTLLIECDLRRPSLAQRLGLEPAPGLSDFLEGKAEPQDIVQTVVQVDTSTSNGSTRYFGEPLACIASGSPTRTPAELLGSDRFHKLLAQVAEVYDRVILDTSPVLPVADTFELLPHVDGILLCVRSGRTTQEQALAGRDAIAKYPKRPLGVVVTGLKARDEREYGAYYRAYAGRAAK